MSIHVTLLLSNDTADPGPAVGHFLHAFRGHATSQLVDADAGQPQILLSVPKGSTAGDWSVIVASRYFSGLRAKDERAGLAASGAAVVHHPAGLELRYSFARGKAAFNGSLSWEYRMHTSAAFNHCDLLPQAFS